MCLDDVKICNWKKLVAIIQKQNTLSLDAKFMELPPKIHDIEIFWAQFIQAMKVCTNLKVLKLYGCPANILNRVMSVSSHLTILKASFVW